MSESHFDSHTPEQSTGACLRTTAPYRVVWSRLRELVRFFLVWLLPHLVESQRLELRGILVSRLRF